jgi:hypothetical protein
MSGATLWGRFRVSTVGGVERASGGALPTASRAAAARACRDDRRTLRAASAVAAARRAYEACEEQMSRVSSLSLVRYCANDYSVRLRMDTAKCW